MGLTGRRLLVGTAGAAGALLGGVVLGGGLVYAGQMLPAPARDRTLDIIVTLTRDGRVLLPAERPARHHVNGLLLEAGFLRYGGPVEQHGPSIARAVLDLDGDPPMDVPLPARFDTYIHRDGPASVGLAHEEVAVTTELGPAPAWFLAGQSSRWAIVVHGRSGTRGEGVRLLPVLAELGLPTLVITHRNDMAGGPTTADGVGRFGQVEWRDLAAAIDHALAAGARDVVLLGYSQGASLIGYLLRERGAAGVAGVVLDSPLLDLGDTLVAQARLRSVPAPLIPPILVGTRWVASRRAGFDVDDVHHVATFAESRVPTLVLHGDADDFVPIGPSDELARRRPDLVYERLPGAGHTEGFNADPARYTAALKTFLRRLPG